MGTLSNKYFNAQAVEEALGKGDIMKIKDRLSKLIDVKTIVTFAMTGTFVFMCVIGKIESDTFVPIFSTILGWYYGSQSKKGDNSESK